MVCMRTLLSRGGTVPGDVINDWERGISAARTMSHQAGGVPLVVPCSVPWVVCFHDAKAAKLDLHTATWSLNALTDRIAGSCVLNDTRRRGCLARRERSIAAGGPTADAVWNPSEKDHTLAEKSSCSCLHTTSDLAVNWNADESRGNGSHSKSNQASESLAFSRTSVKDIMAVHLAAEEQLSADSARGYSSEDGPEPSMQTTTVRDDSGEGHLQARQMEERGLQFWIGDAFYRAESALSRDLSTLAAAVYRDKHGRLTVIDAMAGCGVRAARYLSQAGADFVWANDASIANHLPLVQNLSRCSQLEACNGSARTLGSGPEVEWGMEAATEGVAPGGDSTWRVSHDDVVRVLSSRRSGPSREDINGAANVKDDHFDIVDIDSFGSDAWMFSSALQAVRYGGMIYVTCTDGLTAGGHQPLTSLASYGAMVLRLPYANEIGIRMLIGGLVRQAAMWGLHAWPVFSHYSYHGPVFRAMMRIQKIKGSHSWPSEWYAFIGYCHSCGESRVVQWEDLGNVFCACRQDAGRPMQLTGPLWVGPLHTEEDVREMESKAESWGWITSGQTKEAGGSRSKGKSLDLRTLLEIMLEECQPGLSPYYTSLDLISRFGRIQTPRRDALVQALRQEGYIAGRSHVERSSVKTNAPMAECIRNCGHVLITVVVVVMCRSARGVPAMVPDEEDAHADVNLLFGLCSGSSTAMTRKLIINPHPDGDWGDAALVGRSGGGSSIGSPATKKTRDRHCLQSKSAPATRPEVVRSQRMQLPSPLSGGQVSGRRSGGGGVDARFAVDVDERTGRRVWAEHRQQLRGDREDAITRGVRQLHVGGSDTDKEAAVEVDDFEDMDEEDEDNEEAAVDIRPVGRTSMGGWGRSKKAYAAHGRQTKKTASGGSDGEGDIDVDSGRNFWSVDHMVALVSAKRDQDAHLEGMGHAFARMKPREWKWQDVHETLKKVGVARSGENCGKKWDNLMQQFKKVHRFMQESGKPDYFQLTGKERRSHGFNFVMERAVYEEIKGSTTKNHTIHERNVADTGAPGGVEMSSGSWGGRGDGGGVGDVGGEPQEEEDGSTKVKETESSTSLTPRRQAVQDEAVSGAFQRAVGSCGTGGAGGVVAAAGAGGAVLTRAAGGAAHAVNNTDDEDEEPLANRVWRGNGPIVLAEQTRLWVDDNRFWNDTEDNRMYKIVNGTRNYLVSVVRGVNPLSRSVVLPHSSIAQGTITDESQLREATERAAKVQRVVMRVIHGWIFKSTSRSQGYTAAYGYLLQHVATDITRAMWCAEEWSVCVSSVVCHVTLELGMQVPLWFVSTHIEDRPEDDELAIYQEETLQRLVAGFTSAVVVAELQDGGRLSHDRLKNVAEGMKVFVVVVMWLMRMSGHDLRSHYAASFFVQLAAKPTLLASMHCSFDARRHITQAANVVTERLCKPPMVLADSPHYILDWASCGVKFGHDANLPSPDDAKRLDWLGTGPLEEEDDDDGEQQKVGGR
ncbi:hypothetical protein CBR_g8316 [Chara braunii]|uniref:Myb/SANT-like DNA-binding domain-containing protein n=1 Tax=Chara braunii TaxID=69332 RepID=A0A388KLZ2_CHABU|nr:hypothetical protein CBR_g8316 [Chara braunii]|eukprot:GBG71018.1 hypothetical protein CBR_g8316 [Chara braunii]